uniref:Uncharacterized protein n=1 Tax=Anguilla anguilla TaxID=7936 RepID=A0A0E9UBH7_ANGAN
MLKRVSGGKAEQQRSYSKRMWRPGLIKQGT